MTAANSMSPPKLHLIEPTLQNEAGHCYGYATSLLEASTRTGLHLDLWVGNHAQKLFENDIKPDGKQRNAEIHAVFRRRWRRVQTFLVLRRLLRLKQTIFIPTAGRTDLVMLDWLLRGKRQDNIFLHFHQFNATPDKLETLRGIAQRHPEFNILAPTQDLIAVFVRAGFKNCRMIPCPTHKRSDTDIKATGSFGRLVYAGAARQDKGFVEVAALVAHLHDIKSTIPVTVQISPNHVGSYENVVQTAISRLVDSDYPYLKLYNKTLTKSEYQSLFEDAICIQIYDADAYSDKFSGVTLDSLYAGCPIITTEGTWISATVQRFNAGAVVADKNPGTILNAAQKIISNFAEMQNNALHAGKALSQEHDPLNTLLAIKNRLV